MTRCKVGKATLTFTHIAGTRWNYQGEVVVPDGIIVVGDNAGEDIEQRPIKWPFLISCAEEMTDEEVVRWAIEFGSSLSGRPSGSPTVEQAGAIEEATAGASDIEFLPE